MRWSVLATGVGVAFGNAGCGGAGLTPAGIGALPRTHEAGFDQRASWALPVWPGTTLIVPWDGAGRPATGVRATRAGGGALDSTLWRVRVEPAGTAWSGTIARWHAEPADEPLRDMVDSAGTSSSWTQMLAIEIPPGFHDEEIVVAGSRIRVAPSPELIEAAWVSPMPAFTDWRAVLPGSAPDEGNPLLRWRARLLRAGVPDDPTQPVPVLDNPLLEALAVQEELRWRTGLSRLHGADPGVATRVRRRLLSTVEDPATGLVLPVWTQDLRTLEQLKDTLLDERAAESTLAARAEAWLRRQPEAVVWFEHAFAQDTPGGRAGFVRAWVGNTSQRELLAWMEFRAERPAGSPIPEPRVIPPGELVLLEAPVVVPAQGSEVVDVEVHAGGRVQRGHIVVGAIDVEPPGMSLGPLLPAHDTASVLGGEAAVVGTGVCAALLRRLDASGLAPTPVASRARWSLLVESTVAPGHGPGSIEFTFIHESGRTRLGVGADGTVRVEAPPGLPTAGYPTVVTTIVSGNVWSAEVPVPDWCVGLDDRLRVSMIRRGEAGGLWSWPTRVLRALPDRAGIGVIDLGSWDRRESDLRGIGGAAQ